MKCKKTTSSHRHGEDWSQPVNFGKEKIMRLEIRQRGMKVTEEMRMHVRKRLQLALGRFARSIERVWVYLRDASGPRSGLSKKCRIVVELSRRGRVVVAGVDADIFTAITRTANRTRFAVRRHIKQRLARRRSPANSAASHQPEESQAQRQTLASSRKTAAAECG